MNKSQIQKHYLPIQGIRKNKKGAKHRASHRPFQDTLENIID